MTFYLDIYFLIDFTVDLLSLYFAVRLAKVPAKLWRLCLAACFGAASGVLLTICEPPAEWFLLLLPIGYAVTVFITVGRVRFLRFLRVGALFSVFELLLGGTVSFLYQKLDGAVEASGNGFANRSLILVAIGVLTTFGGLKLILSVFGDANAPESVRVEIVLEERSVTVDALVDSGNLAADPIDGTPVMLVGRTVCEKLTGCPVEEIPHREIRKRFRWIPIKSGGKGVQLYGIRPDRVMRLCEKQKGNKIKKEELRLIVAADTEDGHYGEFSALIPARALRGTER